MSVYKGLVDSDSFVRVNDPGLSITVNSGINMEIEFPEDVTEAYVQATNWFPGDRITFQAITVYTSSTRRNVLLFERLRNGSGRQSTGWISFQVETEDSEEIEGYREG